MNKKYKLIILLTVTLALVKLLQILRSHREFNELAVLEEQLNQYPLNGEKVKVTVYYEALCPDSKFFITLQLLPVVEKLTDSLIVDLVPYGKATTIERDGKYFFQCQHEEAECFANRIHACVIKHVTEPLIRVKYIACMIAENMFPEDIGEKCGNELNVDFEPINQCANDAIGSRLLAEYGERTHSLVPPVHFIPTIELNDTQNNVGQSAILKDLLKAVCQLYVQKPTKCV